MTDLSGALAGGVHVFPVRVYYEDTDASGIVYYANYLKFVERARTELSRLLGVDHGGLWRGDGVRFAVRACDLEFLVPAHLDDMLKVHTRLVKVAGASVDAEQVVRRGETDLVRIRLRLACLNRAGRPVRLPSAVRAALKPLSQQLERE